MNGLKTQDVARALGSLSERVFLAGFDGGRVTLHVAAPKARRALRAEARAALSRLGIEADCRVLALDNARVEGAASLQELIGCFSHEGLAYDPTSSVTRAAALVRCAERLRAAFGPIVSGVYFEPETTALVVVCRPEEVASEVRQSLQAQCASVVEAWRREDADAFEIPLLLSLETPKLALVPVDEASRDAARTSPWWSRIGAGVVGLGALMTAVFAGSARAEGPAVSAVNGKLSLEGGAVNTQGSGVAEGSVAFPLGHSFGAQIDGAAGNQAGQPLWGVSGQAFWRDPEAGLAGAFVSHTSRNLPIVGGNVQTNNYGGEGEIYAKRVTFSGLAADQRGPVQHALFGTAQVAWYPVDNLKLSGGGSFVENVNPTLLLGTEYQPAIAALPGLTAFGDAGVTNARGQKGGYAMAGFRYYFGPTKTLIKRHREDDPIFNQIDSFGSSARTVQTGGVGKGHKGSY